MSRRIDGHQCNVCYGLVKLDDGLDPYQTHYGVNATCETCGALYVVDTESPIQYLQFRYSRNDEPSAADLPLTCDAHNPEYVRTYREIDAIVQEQTGKQKLAASMLIAKKSCRE